MHMITDSMVCAYMIHDGYNEDLAIVGPSINHDNYTVVLATCLKVANGKA